MKVNIKNDTGRSIDTKVTLDDGTELTGITELQISILPDKMFVVEVKFLNPIFNCNANATVSEEHLRELAKWHGFKLTKDEK